MKKDSILCSEKGEIVKVYPYGGEEQQRFEQALEIIFEADRQRFEEFLKRKLEKEQKIDSQMEVCDKKIF